MKIRGRFNAGSPERRFMESLHHGRLDCRKDNLRDVRVALFDGAAGASRVARQQRGVADESSRIGPIRIAGRERFQESPHPINQSFKTSGTSLLGSLNVILVFLSCHGTSLLQSLEHRHHRLGPHRIIASCVAKHHRFLGLGAHHFWGRYIIVIWISRRLRAHPGVAPARP